MLRELLETYKYPFGCILAGIAAIVSFFVAGIYIEPVLFSRGGSIIVLLGAMAEYGLIQIQWSSVDSKLKGTGNWDQAPVETLYLPKPFPELQKAAHLLVIFGTIIWGFGDLFITPY